MSNLSVFDEHFKMFSKNLSKKSLKNSRSDSNAIANEIYQDKPFSIQFKSLWTTTKILGVLAQFVSAITLTTIIAYILHSVGNFIPLGIIITIALLVTTLLEFFKHNITSISAKYILKYKTLPLFLALSLIVVFSISFSGAILGSLKLPQLYVDIQQKTDSLRIDLSNNLVLEIERLDNEISEAKAQLTKKDNWTLRNRTLPQLERQRAELVGANIQNTSILSENVKNETLKAEAQKTVKIKELQIYVLGISLFFEFLFVVCAIFSYYYLWRCFVETQSSIQDDQLFIEIQEKPQPQRQTQLPQSTPVFDFNNYNTRYETVLNCKSFDIFSKAASLTSDEDDYKEQIGLANKALSILEHDVTQAVKQDDVNSNDVIRTYLERFNKAVTDTDVTEFKELVKNFVTGKSKNNPFAERRLIGFNREPPQISNPTVNNSTVNNSTVTPPIIIEGKQGYKNCEYCSKQYLPKVNWQKFCSKDCKDKHHTAIHGQRFNPKHYHQTKK